MKAPTLRVWVGCDIHRVLGVDMLILILFSTKIVPLNLQTTLQFSKLGGELCKFLGDSFVGDIPEISRN